MPRRRPDRPNVLVFFTDQQRWDSVGLHGNPLDLTPNLDRLARRGTHLPNAFTPQPVCAPTRACLQTGLYPTTSGIFRNHLPLSPRHAEPWLITSARRATTPLTSASGIWPIETRSRPDQRGGYDSWLAANILEFCSDAYDTVLYDEQERAVRSPGYRVDAPWRRGHPIHRGPSGRAVLPVPLVSGAAPPEPPGCLSRARRLRRAVRRTLDAAGSRGAGRLGSAAPGRLLGHGQATGRDARAAARRAQEPVAARRHRGRLHQRPRLPLQDPQQRVQALLPRCLDPRARSRCRGRASTVVARCASWSVSSICRRRCWTRRACRSPGDAGPLDRAARTRRRQPTGRSEVFIQISESQVGRAIRTERWKYSVSAPDVDAWDESASDRYVEEFLYDLEADPHELTNLAGIPAFREVADVLRRALDRADGRRWGDRPDDRAGYPASAERARRSSRRMDPARRRLQIAAPPLRAAPRSSAAHRGRGFELLRVRDSSGVSCCAASGPTRWRGHEAGRTFRSVTGPRPCVAAESALLLA